MNVIRLRPATVIDTAGPPGSRRRAMVIDLDARVTMPRCRGCGVDHLDGRFDRNGDPLRWTSAACDRCSDCALDPEPPK